MATFSHCSTLVLWVKSEGQTHSRVTIETAVPVFASCYLADEINQTIKTDKDEGCSKVSEIVSSIYAVNKCLIEKLIIRLIITAISVGSSTGLLGFAFLRWKRKINESMLVFLKSFSVTRFLN